jgi:hypothetical protein
MMKYHDGKFRGLINNATHFKRVREVYYSLNDQKGRTYVEHASEFPSDLSGQVKLVEELFNAMLNFDDFIDEPRQKRRKRRKMNQDAEEEEDNDNSVTDSTHVRRVRQASDLEIELLAWELLVSCHLTISPSLC